MPAVSLPVLTAPLLQSAPNREAAPSTPGVVQLTSDALFAGAREVHILHDGAVYRLKRTALGKLILTK